MPKLPESCASCSATGVPVSPGSAVIPADRATHEVVSAKTLPFFLIDDLDGGVPSLGIGKMRTSYKARQQRQYHERNDKANLQLFVCAHDIGQAGLQLGYRRMLGYLTGRP